MDEIETRLKETSEKCLATYETWLKDKASVELRENLMEAVHELRKVAARLEIEIAVSERDQMTQKPIPIPPHRSSRKRPQNNDAADNAGNKAEVGNGEGNKQSGGNADTPRPQNRKKAGGGRRGTLSTKSSSE